MGPAHSAVIQPYSFTSFRSPLCFELPCFIQIKITACSKHFSRFTKRVYFVYSKVTHKTGCPSFFLTYALTTDYIITDDDLLDLFAKDLRV